MKKPLCTLLGMLCSTLIFSQVEMGGASDYSKVEADGTLEFNGAATVWNDFVVSPDVKSSQSNGPTWQDFIVSTLKALAFSGGTQMGEVFFDVQMPHTWREGTTIYPHIHWAPEDASGGNVIWYLEYTWANYPGTFPTPTTINTGAVAAGNTAFAHIISPFPASGGIDGTGKKISSVMRCRVYRTPTGDDTYGGLAFAISIDFHYETNTVGSRSEYTK